MTARFAPNMLNPNLPNPDLPKPDVLNPACPSRRILGHVTGRWAGLVLMALADGPLRFGALRRRVGGISERMLAQTLDVLEGDGLVLRTARAAMPPHVDYALTPLGAGVSERVCALAAWIEANLPAFPPPRA
jgi:DNA-binding HxlR family transcriptional regulator